MRISILSELAPVPLHKQVWWAEPAGNAPERALASLDLGDELTVVSANPAVWRSLAAAFLATADELDALYAEHGTEPPAGGDL